MTISVFLVVIIEKNLRRLIKRSFVQAQVAKMYFLLMMLRVRGSWNTRVNKCIMTNSVFLIVIIEKVLEDS